MASDRWSRRRCARTLRARDRPLEKPGRTRVVRTKARPAEKLIPPFLSFLLASSCGPNDRPSCFAARPVREGAVRPLSESGGPNEEAQSIDAGYARRRDPGPGGFGGKRDR